MSAFEHLNNKPKETRGAGGESSEFIEPVGPTNPCSA